ncbi:hypothetical protein PAXINDRAFT_156819 [Paxillus involutus ATCC 200175]|uniref:DUF8190 domain-containing protein n=1 Tax=Paxillus involutus ATCC 200175 TaxID=664439 RepID=A0A0C9TQG6_PAXIN|nr:hypothetical protein PAXINDRAFT_156819 [Paxillus involutus ATCC 200175]
MSDSEADHGESQLPNMMVMFIAHILAEMRYEDIHCHPTYPQPLTSNSMKEEAVEVLLFCCYSACQPISSAAGRVNLRLNDFKVFHQEFVECWDDWVSNAPRSWTVD